MLFAVLLWPLPAAADAQDFVVDSFEAGYLITKASYDVSVADVTEIIAAAFPEFDQNHGILRALPESYNGHSLEINIKAVTDGGGGW